MNFSNVISLFFKRRFVFIANVEDYNNLNFNQKMSNISFEYISKTNFNKVIDVYETCKNDPKMKHLEKRLNYPEIWKGIIAILDGKPVGCHWILLPLNNKLFYDSFEVDNKSALFCGVYVNPNYRGKRVYNTMQFFVYNMWMSDFPDRNIITIVEKKNELSLRSNFRIGLEVKGVNYLFKFFGKNLLSIYYSSYHKIQIWNILSMKSGGYY